MDLGQTIKARVVGPGEYAEEEEFTGYQDKEDETRGEDGTHTHVQEQHR